MRRQGRTFGTLTINSHRRVEGEWLEKEGLGGDGGKLVATWGESVYVRFVDVWCVALTVVVVVVAAASHPRTG